MEYLIKGQDYLEQTKNFKLVGRKTEMDKLLSILMRKRSNSVLLVGPSGVGATALCVGLQAMKKDENAPFDLVSKRIFWLDTDNLFSLDNAEIIRNFDVIMKRLTNSVDSILVIEDAGDFYEACKNNGTMNFVNRLNAAVKESKLQVILEVSDSDLTKIVTWHSDFSEFYTTMDVTEPVGEALQEILKNTSEKLSEFHSIRIDEEAISTAIEITLKYRVDSGLGSIQPSRAISLLDRALASYRINAHQNPPNIVELQKNGDVALLNEAIENHKKIQTRLRELHSKRRACENAIAQYEDKISQIEQKEQANSNGVDSVFLTIESPEIVKYKENIEIIRDEYAKHDMEYIQITKEINEKLVLKKEHVIQEFARITGISASKLGEDDKVILKNLENVLKSHIFGQDHVLKKAANAIKVSRIGNRNKDKPQASFLFMGPSGVGKCVGGNTKIMVQLPQHLLELAIEKGYV